MSSTKVGTSQAPFPLPLQYIALASEPRNIHAWKDCSDANQSITGDSKQIKGVLSVIPKGPGRQRRCKLARDTVTLRHSCALKRRIPLGRNTGSGERKPYSFLDPPNSLAHGSWTCFRKSCGRDSQHVNITRRQSEHVLCRHCSTRCWSRESSRKWRMLQNGTCC